MGFKTSTFKDYSDMVHADRDLKERFNRICEVQNINKAVEWLQSIAKNYDCPCTHKQADMLGKQIFIPRA